MFPGHIRRNQPETGLSGSPGTNLIVPVLPSFRICSVHHIVARADQEPGTLVGNGSGALRKVEVVADVDPEWHPAHLEGRISPSLLEYAFTGEQLHLPVGSQDLAMAHDHGRIEKAPSVHLDQAKDNCRLQMCQTVQQASELVRIEIKGKISRFTVVEQVPLEVALREADQVSPNRLRIHAQSKDHLHRTGDVAVDVFGLAGCYFHGLNTPNLSDRTGQAGPRFIPLRVSIMRGI